MKIYIVADGEGISGVVSSDEMHPTGSRFDSVVEFQDHLPKSVG